MTQEPGEKSGGKRALLVVSGPTHNTASDRAAISALDRFGGMLIQTLRDLRRARRLPTNLDIGIFTVQLGIILSTQKIGRVEPDGDPLETELILERFNQLLSVYDCVCLVLTDDDWTLLRTADSLKRSALDVKRITGYQSNKRRGMLDWIDGLE